MTKDFPVSHTHTHTHTHTNAFKWLATNISQRTGISIGVIEKSVPGFKREYPAPPFFSSCLNPKNMFSLLLVFGWNPGPPCSKGWQDAMRVAIRLN